MPMILTSAAFAPGGAIPAEYTCSGADISPPLTWSGVPPGTGSLVLVVEDPDAPSGTFRHWVVFDIPPGMRGLGAGYGRRHPEGGLREARNDFGRLGYGGPCPPPGPPHHYQFRLIAISRPRLEVSPSATGVDVLRAAQPYAIAQAEMVGTFQR
ncbi:MAG TPA: YbhB/YbcL family Raf kinase inhibitor-like protein [Stellaceae bacterium]|jgi:Raf kinase inhibitor-like YbhB/YbcL family protein|nr:YbhB/YbcL family Raf kinase inhibitor-like protein [Stellaceae bacterium]